MPVRIMALKRNVEVLYTKVQMIPTSCEAQPDPTPWMTFIM